MFVRSFLLPCRTSCYLLGYALYLLGYALRKMSLEGCLARMQTKLRSPASAKGSALAWMTHTQVPSRAMASSDFRGRLITFLLVGSERPCEVRILVRTHAQMLPANGLTDGARLTNSVPVTTAK